MSKLSILAGLVATSLVTEDVAMLSAVALMVTEQITFTEAFVTCVSGLFLGDIALYFLGAAIKRGMPLSAGLTRFFEKHRSSFIDKALPFLFGARFVPGLRLPSYLAAGYFGCQPLPMIWILLTSGVIWTSLWLVPAHKLARIGSPYWAMAWASLFLMMAIIFRYAKRNLKLRAQLERIRSLSSFEFWPASIFYLPVIAYVVRLMVKYRSITLPTLANPAIETGGLIGESKDEIFRLLQGKEENSHLLKYERISVDEGPAPAVRQVLEFMGRARLSFPIILKPDTGQRGSGVRLIRTRTELDGYFAVIRSPVIAQQYCDYPVELGIFYTRSPGSMTGKIISVTHKVFPHVIGDGVSSLGELILDHDRARWMAAVYFKRHRKTLSRVLARGECFRLVESGNHCQGTLFLNGSRFNTESLRLSLDLLLSEIDGFHIGRLDVRFPNEESAMKGLDWKIIEVNGAGSEATHIYDPQTSLVSAYRTLFQQWRLMFEVGDLNRERGFRSTSSLALIRKVLEYRKLNTHHPETT